MPISFRIKNHDKFVKTKKIIGKNPLNILNNIYC